jgi:hypothetical protein
MRKILFLLLLLAAGTASAQQRQYAVLSLLGDKLLVAQYYPNESGFRSDGGLQALVSLDDNSFDKTALQTADKVIKTFEPAAKPVLLVARDTSLYEAAAGVAKAGQSSKALLERLAPMLRGSGATHLVLFTKLKQPARVQKFKDTALGSGDLEGLGFYVDTGRGGPNEPGSQAEAVFGPFAYFRMELIDLARGEIVKEERVAASRAFAAAQSGNPWGLMNNKEKVVALQDVIRRETEKVLPSLLGKGPRL